MPYVKGSDDTDGGDGRLHGCSKGHVRAHSTRQASRQRPVVLGAFGLGETIVLLSAMDRDVEGRIGSEPGGLLFGSESPGSGAGKEDEGTPNRVALGDDPGLEAVSEPPLKVV